MQFGVPKKLAKSVPKCIKKGNKKVNEKIHFLHLFNYFYKKTLYFTGRNGPCGAIILYFTMYLRVRKKQKMKSNVAKT